MRSFGSSGSYLRTEENERYELVLALANDCVGRVPIKDLMAVRDSYMEISDIRTLEETFEDQPLVGTVANRESSRRADEEPPSGPVSSSQVARLLTDYGVPVEVDSTLASRIYKLIPKRGRRQAYIHDMLQSLALWSTDLSDPVLRHQTTQFIFTLLDTDRDGVVTESALAHFVLLQLVPNGVVCSMEPPRESLLPDLTLVDHMDRDNPSFAMPAPKSNAAPPERRRRKKKNQPPEPEPAPAEEETIVPGSRTVLRVPEYGRSLLETLHVRTYGLGTAEPVTYRGFFNVINTYVLLVQDAIRTAERLGYTEANVSDASPSSDDTTGLSRERLISLGEKFNDARVKRKGGPLVEMCSANATLVQHFGPKTGQLQHVSAVILEMAHSVPYRREAQWSRVSPLDNGVLIEYTDRYKFGDSATPYDVQGTLVLRLDERNMVSRVVQYAEEGALARLLAAKNTHAPSVADFAIL